MDIIELIFTYTEFKCVYQMITIELLRAPLSFTTMGLSFYIWIWTMLLTKHLSIYTSIYGMYSFQSTPKSATRYKIKYLNVITRKHIIKKIGHMIYTTTNNTQKAYIVI